MKYSLRLAAFLAVILGVPALLPAALLYDVTIDTTPLAGISGFMAFDLLGGSPLQNNVATISGFMTTGTLGSASSSGAVSGNLTPGPLTLTANQFFNEELQAITFAAGLTTFKLNLTTNFAPGTTPDSFSFFLLNSSSVPFPTSDPAGSLFAIDLVGPDTSPNVFTSATATATVTVDAGGSTVPEPASWTLLSLALAGLVILPKARLSLS